MKNLLLSVLALIAAGTSSCAIEAWLDHGGFNRSSAWFLGAFAVSLIALIVLLGLHLGRWL